MGRKEYRNLENYGMKFLGAFNNKEEDTKGRRKSDDKGIATKMSLLRFFTGHWLPPCYFIGNGRVHRLIQRRYDR